MPSNMNRRRFLALSRLSALFFLPSFSCRSKRKKPNILIILTDQQHAGMMSCTGNSFLKTPAMDSLAASGVRFERAYATNPVCVPSRFSLMTGRMPSEIGIRSNDLGSLASVPEEIKMNGLGHLLRKAGYETVYGGKVHLPKMTAEDIGFEYICKDERDELARVAADYLSQAHEKPFCLVASFINPHDICYMAIRDFAETEGEKRLVSRGVTETQTLDRALQRPAGMSEDEFFQKVCPPLPDNHLPQEDEPEAIRWLIAQRPFRQKARDTWSEQRWREHRWAYQRLAEFVDAQIGRVLETLRQSEYADNTIVIFTSDHGDHDAAHKLEHKSTFYDEACRIPLIISGPGVTAGRVDRDHLISNGLDLLPTVCDYASVEPPADLKGKSLRPLAEGKKTLNWREALPVESEIGKMIVTRRYKYMVYDRGRDEEQVIDLQASPGEMKSMGEEAERQGVLKKLRRFV